MVLVDYFAGLHPLLVTKMQAVLAQMAALQHPMKPCQGLRTAAYQHDLWLKGRVVTVPGPVVTNCDGYVTKSRHQAAKDGFGHAIDCCFEGSDPFGIKQPWKVYGAAVKAQGLTWGGDFHLVDLDHAEMP